MKGRGTLVLLLVVSLAMVPVLSQGGVRSQVQSHYSESIDVYTAGSNAYTFVTMNELNSTSTKLTSAESTSGLSGYRLVAVSSQDETSDYQIFGADGYNLLRVPFIPSQGLFLFVNASSPAAAAPLVSYFDGLFATNFTSLSSSAGQYSFFGSVQFTTNAAPKLFSLVPTTEKGFSVAYTESEFAGFALPSVTLAGELSPTNGTFTHTISLGGASTNVISSSSTLAFLTAVSQTNKTISASSASIKSVVVVHSLDGYIYSTDSGATVSNAASGLSGTYTLSVAAGKAAKPNVTIDSQVATLNAYRTAVLSTAGGSEYVAVTIYLSNTAENVTGENIVVQSVKVDDNWWQQDPSLFQISSGNTSYDTTIARIVGGHNTTLVYSLKVLSSAPSEFIVPASTVSYSYAIGNTTATATVTLNEVDLQLNSNPEPEVNVFVQPDFAYLSGSSIGSNASFVVTISNNGPAPATNLEIANQIFSNLPADSTLPAFKVSVPFASLLQRNVSETYTLRWTTPSQQIENITANSVTLLLSHTSMAIPFVEADSSETVTTEALTTRLLNVTYAFTNAGTADARSVTATQSFPPGITCKVINSSQATCNGNEAAFDLTSLTPKSPQAIVLQLNFTENNFIVNPAEVSAIYGASGFVTATGPYVIAGGVSLTKSFSPDVVFPGMPTKVTLGLTNSGTQTLYNVSLSSTADSFDTVPSGTSTLASYGSVAPQQSEAFSYTVTVNQQASGSPSGVIPTASMTLGGITQSVAIGNSTLLIYKPLSAAVSVSPSNPSDGHNFDVTFMIENSSPVAVSNITLTWKLPAGITSNGGASSGGTVTKSFASLAAGSTQNVTLTLKAAIGLSLSTGTDSRLTYSYQNSTLDGVITARQITVSEDILTGYELPVAVAIIIALAAVVYMRRGIAPVVTAGPEAAAK